MPPTPSTQYVDFDVFTDKDFDAVKYANSLVQAINNPTDTDVDLSSALARVNFDVEEVDKLIDNETQSKNEALWAGVRQVDVATKVLQTTDASLEGLKSSIRRLSANVVTPYETAMPIAKALSKMHETIGILRNVTRFLQLKQSISALSLETDSRSGVRVIVALQEARSIRMPPLRCLEGHYSDLQAQESAWLAKAQSSLSTFSASSDVSITSSAAVILYLLQPNFLFTSINNYVASQVIATVGAIARSTLSTTAFDRALSDAANRAALLVSFSSVLSSTFAPDASDSILELVLQHFGAPLVSWYWRDVASGLESRLRSGLRVKGLSFNEVRSKIHSSLSQGGGKTGEREFAVMTSIIAR